MTNNNWNEELVMSKAKPLLKCLLVSSIFLCLYYLFEVKRYVPTHGSKYKYSRLTRLGSELTDFNYMTCPRSSLMLQNSLKHVKKPRHDDCPQVFILGARKGGTTSLISYLSRHPNFTAGNLNDTRLWHVGGTGHFGKLYTKEKWSKYKAKFVGDGNVLGESSVENFANCFVPARMYKSCGDDIKSMKFIALLRNPVERFQSNYQFRAMVHDGYMGWQKKNKMNMTWFVEHEISNFYIAMHENGLNMDTMQDHLNDLFCIFTKIRRPNAIYEGLYLVHLHLWLCNVPAENILILNSEDFFHHTADVLSEVIQFIGLSPLSNEMLVSIVSQKYNASPKLKLKDTLSQSERQRIKDLYQPFNLKLLDLLQWPHTLWS